jgi:hypothetical protein
MNAQPKCRMSAKDKEDRSRHATERIRIMIDKGMTFSATIFFVVSTSAFDLDDVENQ